MGEATIYENAESATLLQVGGRKGQPKDTTHGGLHAMLKQSRAMLYEDTPSEVRAFMERTLKEIEEDVQPLIREQHATDQNVLDGFTVTFNDIISQYSAKKTELETLRQRVTTTSSGHKSCRESQLQKYFEVRKCKHQQDALFDEFKAKEQAYKRNTHEYCGEVAVDDRDHFTSVKETALDYFESWNAYEKHREGCIPKNTTYADERARCDTMQVGLEAASCESHILHVTSWNSMVDQWQAQKASFEREVNAAKSNSESRLNEMHTLIEVTCLLRKVDERGGKACTEADEEQVNADIDECKKALNDAIPALTLSIPEVPSTPVAPTTMPWPCTDDYEEEHYSNEALAASAIAAEPHEQAAAWAEESLAKMPVCDVCVVDESLKIPEENEEAPIEGQAKIQVGSIMTDDTHIDGASFVKQHTFPRPFAVKPVVVGVISSNGPHSAQLQIFDITRTGFKYSVMEPAGWDGPHVAEKVSFIAAVPGITEMGAAKVHAGIIPTAHTVGRTFDIHAEGNPEVNKIDNKWEVAQFAEAFQDASGTESKPALLTGLQTTNNQDLGASVTQKKPWLVVAVKDLTEHGFKVSLDRCEAKDGTAVSEAEEIGYIALSPGSGEVEGVKYSVKHAESSGKNMGWDDQENNLMETVAFHEDMPDAIAVAAKVTRHGSDGGWLRVLSQTASSIEVVVDEDTTNDNERKHMPEDVGMAAFSGPLSFP